MERFCVFDIETASLAEAETYLPSPKARANLKDPVKIEADLREKTAASLERAALDPDLCRIVAAGWEVDGTAESAVCEDAAQERELLERFDSPRTGRWQDAGASPGSFPPRLTGVNDAYAPTAGGQLIGDRQPDDASTNHQTIGHRTSPAPPILRDSYNQPLIVSLEPHGDEAWRVPCADASQYQFDVRARGAKPGCRRCAWTYRSSRRSSNSSTRPRNRSLPSMTTTGTHAS